MLLAFAALLPALYWQEPPETAATLHAANIQEISVPPPLAGAWRLAGFRTLDPPPGNCIQLNAPKVEYRPNVARATSAPWVDENGWRYLRGPRAGFCIKATADAAALATAEAWTYGANAYILADAEGAKAWAEMSAFLRSLPDPDLPPLVNIGLVDDGSPKTGEVMNLLLRRNILFRIVPEPDPALDLNVKLSWKEHPNLLNADPSKLAYNIREELGDDRRLLRIYGSEVVIGRLFGDRDRVRVVLLNYGARPVEGLRVRVRRPFTKAGLRAYAVPDAAPSDISTDAEAIEFTVPMLRQLAVVELTK